MKTLKITLITLCVSLIAPSSYALSTLTLTLVNHSKETLYFTGVTEKNSGNNFNISTVTIAPNSTAVVTGTTIASQDLAGYLHFSDSSGMDNPFLIVDYRKFKEGQPIFDFNKMNKKFISILTSKTFNPDKDPRALTYSAASVEIANLPHSVKNSG